MNLILLGLGALTGAAIIKAKKPKMVRPTKAVNYAVERILNAKLPPEKYEAASHLFRQYGLFAEADAMLQRAHLASLGPLEKEKIREASRQALQSDKPEGIRKVADSIEQMGASGSAKELRNYAEQVEIANSIEAEVPSELVTQTKPNADTAS